MKRKIDVTKLCKLAFDPSTLTPTESGEESLQAIFFATSQFTRSLIISRGHATLHLAVSVGRSVGPSVCHIFWISSGFCITAPAQPSATGVPCIRPCWLFDGWRDHPTTPVTRGWAVKIKCKCSANELPGYLVQGQLTKNLPDVEERCIYMNKLAHFRPNLLNCEQIWFILMHTLSVWS